MTDKTIALQKRVLRQKQKAGETIAGLLLQKILRLRL